MNAFLISGLLLFLGLACFQQSRQQHSLVASLSGQSNDVVNALTARMAADRAASERSLQTSIAEIMAAVAPDMMAADDLPGLQNYADILVRTPDVTEAAFIGVDGKIVAGAHASAAPGRGNGDHSSGDHGSFVLERPIRSFAERYGTFRIVVSDERLRVSVTSGRQAAQDAVLQSRRAAERSLRQADLTMVLTMVALAALMAAMSTALFRSQIGKPLGAITTALQKLAAQQMDEVIPGTGRRDEIGDIAAAAVVFKDSMVRAVQLAEANVQLTRLSATDGMTGIANRRAFDSSLLLEWSRAARYTTDLALLMVDVDFFKRYNDHYGHLGGDDCLRTVAAQLSAAMRRQTDLAARYGGEEFVALLPGATEAGARVVAERLRSAIEEACLPHAAAPLGRVSVSIGVASMAGMPTGDPQSLIRLADGALYEAKQGGRNQVRGASDRQHVEGPKADEIGTEIALNTETI